MAKFDISPVSGGTGSCVLRSSVLTRSEDRLEAIYEPTLARRVGTVFTRMRSLYVAVKPLHWGNRPQVMLGLLILVLWVSLKNASADPVSIAPDPPARHQPVVVPAGALRPSWDLDGLYLWLGPIGAASYVDTDWDSTFGGEAALVRVRERARLGLLGGNLGASRWTERGGGRVWLDGLLGTRVLGRMVGVSLGPIVELSELAHPRPGASIGIWGFAGVTPFARVGAVSQVGIFAEVGIHVALPVVHR